MQGYELAVILIGSLTGILTSYTDVKTGFIFDSHVFPTLSIVERLFGHEEGEEEVNLPRWLGRIVVPTAEFGVLLYVYLGIRGQAPPLAGLIGLIVGFAMGMVLYYAGAWASGDVVVLAAFSALLPYPLSFVRVAAPYETAYPLYPLAVLFNSILAVFPFLFFYALGIVVKKGEMKRIREVFVDGVSLSLEVSLWFMAGIAVAVALSNYGFGLSAPVRYGLALLVVAVFGKYRKVGDIIGLASLAYLSYLVGLDAVTAFLKLIAVMYSFKVFFSTVKVLREEALVEEVPVEELREWDILGETIYIEGENVRRDRRGFFEVLREGLRTGKLQVERGEVVASPSAEGLSGEQIERLKKLVEEGKIENRFLRKKAMPFAPSIFAGFLISALWGDLFWWLVLKTAGL
ncbi:A24 family peptidase C-terminal domain-containing protein [Thermococcus sp.]